MTEPTLLAGRYELGRVIGLGGMARVHEARDRVLERRVAVKVVPEGSLDTVTRERFVREARSSARFVHPNAVAVHDAGEADGTLFLVMELVDGPTLATHLAQRGPLPVEEAVRITDGVLAALGAAHSAGIVHRDVKPGNILLDGQGAVKLADFGIAKRLDDLAGDLTGTGQFIGTPKYLAPEQVAGEPATPATDVYATGVVLYEMLAGHPPFDAGTPVATALAHRHQPAPDLRAARPDVPNHIAALVTRAMAKDPAARFHTAAEMTVALHDPSWAPTAATSAPTGRLATVPAPTQKMRVPPQPPGPAGPSRSSGRRGAAAAVALLVAAVAAAAVVLALTNDDGDPADAPPEDSVAVETSATTAGPTSSSVPVAVATTAVAETSPPPTPAPTTTPTTTTTTPATVPPAPTTVDELIDLLEQDPEIFGPAGPNLVSELIEVDAANGREASDRAAQLLDDVAGWVDDDELDAAVAELTRSLLADLADGPGEGGDNRSGRGDGEG